MGINVLSLFDGMSCGQQALERSVIQVDNYFASEIDKYAIQVTMANYPNTIQLGSVVNVIDYELPKIDLLIGGSPCQSFSFAGKRKGMSTKCETEILTLEHYLELKADSYEFEGQSYLFWEFMRLLNQCKPKYFLLENVEMGDKWEKVLSKAIGVNGIHINSALVSAQNRKRIYWTNIGMQPGGLFGDLHSIIQQPKDKGILLKDILEHEVEKKYYFSEKMINGFKNKKSEWQGQFKPTDGNKKGNCVTSRCFKMGVDDNYIIDIVGLTEVRTKEAKQIRKETGTNPKRSKELVERTDGKTGAILTSLTNDNLVKIREVKQINPSLESGGNQPYQQNRIYDTNGISPALCANKSDLIIAYGCDYRKDEGFRIRDIEKSTTLMARAREDIYGTGLVKTQSNIRRLTPLECERLQTVKDNYTNHVSDAQRYKMLGNGWTVDVISHILNYIK